MERIALRQWGSFLGTRLVGQQALREIHSALRSDQVVEVDFAGVQGISHSFADEVIGTIARELGLEGLTARVRFTHLNEQIRALLRFVVADRTRSYLQT